MIEEGKTAKEATLITGINIRTAQHYIKKYNDDDERHLPDGYRKPRVRHLRKLTDAYSHFLMEYVDMHPTAVLDIRDKLCQNFRGLSISVSALHRHLVQKCAVTLNKHRL